MPPFRFLIALAGAALLTSTAVRADNAQEPVASLGLTAAPDAAPPQELSPADAKRYKAIFLMQEKGRWRDADKLIKEIDDPILMGHVRYQRLMHPTAYRSSYAELRDWMAKYNDHPEAERVYKLALKRRGKAAWPKAPEAAPIKGAGPQAANRRPPTHAVSRFRRDFMRHVSRHQYDKAERDFMEAVAKHVLRGEEIGRYGAYLAEKMMSRGADTDAFRVASAAADAGRDARYQPDWTAGLAAWRLGDCAKALIHFRAVAASKVAPDREMAAGAYWAARSAFACKAPEQAYDLLRQAAAQSRSFYGMIAERQLGMESRQDWRDASLTDQGWRDLKSMTAVRRVIALVEVGELAVADQELRNAWRRAKDEDYSAFLALAQTLNLPLSQYRLAIERPDNQPLPLAAFYPLPGWEPEDGFSLDKALIFALIRQESAFSSRAKSHAGARGLMQVMPRTAGYIARDRKLVRDREGRLYDPAYNMALGQDYLEYLADNEATNGNLFMLFAAYNGGPGNVARWNRKLDFRGDPLLFMETIPLRETRLYVERVMANFWMYRRHLGQETPSLDAIASGAWPEYEELDRQPEQQLADMSY